MEYNFNDIKPSLIHTLVAALGDAAYLIKGGQAISVHFERIHAASEARFSRDIDFSLSTPSFPVDLKRFLHDFQRIYNSNPQYSLQVRNIKLKKIPENEAAYFGIRMSINFGKKKPDGRPGKKVFFKDIASVAIVIDFACNEYVDDAVTSSIDAVKIAKIPLIVAEKFRALCSNLHDPGLNPFPRPKDFYDLFAIYSLVFKRVPDPSSLREISLLLNRCFALKNMDVSLLKQLDTEQQKSFHSRNFQQQVLDTLELASTNKNLTFDQAYSESLEFLDKILAI
jgi:predicted nucleotidyltransferase component of viral defense system